MQFGLIIIGDEILSGRREDKHLAKSIEIFAARGLQVAYADYVGDVPARITATLERAFASGDVVFSFGGIGATPDDHTRQCAAAALRRPLQLHPQAEVLIMERVRKLAEEQGKDFDPARADNQHRLNMGVFPEGAEIIPNPYNQIPGFRCQGAGAGAVHFVPGFPVMAWPMVEAELDTHYRSYSTSGSWQVNSVFVFGAIEASLTPLMQRIEQAHAVKVFSLPSVDHPEYGRHIELGVKGSPSAAEAAFADMPDSLKSLAIPLGPLMVRN